MALAKQNNSLPINNSLNDKINSKWKKHVSNSILNSDKNELAFHLNEFNIYKLIVEPNENNLPPIFEAIMSNKNEMINELLTLFNNKYKNTLIKSTYEINLGTILGKDSITPFQYDYEK